jgi:VWFA-related protein
MAQDEAVTTRLARTWTLRVALTMLAATLVSARQGQRPVFRATTDIIATELRVTDGGGKFIPNLTINDFEILEDGVPQKITNMVLTLGGRVMTQVVPVAPAVREGLILPPSPPVADQSGRVFIIFVDDMHIQFKNTSQARTILRNIRDTLVHEGDLIGIVSTGYSSLEVGLNYDVKKKRFNEAINRTSGSALSPQEIIDASQTADGPAGVRHNTFVAFKTAYDMLEHAAKIPNRRKAFIYLSEGYNLNPYTQSRFKNMQQMRATGVPRSDQSIPGQTGGDNQMSSDDVMRFRNPFETNGQQFAESDLIAALAELTDTARRANVAFYTIDPRGLQAGPDISTNLTTDEFWANARISTDSLRVLANETGGFCTCDKNDYTKALQQIDNEMSDYYLLGYVSSNPDPLKVLRRIEIRVKRQGLKLEYNPTYTIKRK